MKFKYGTYWKHRNGRDAFIRVIAASDTGTEAALRVEWWIQGIEICGIAPINGKDAPDQFQEIYISPEHYSNWEPYEPRGTYL